MVYLDHFEAHLEVNTDNIHDDNSGNVLGSKLFYIF